MTQTDDPQTLLDDLLARAKAAGADAADAIYARGDSLAHTQRLGEIEMLERSEGHDLGLRVMIGRRQAIVSSTDMSDGAIADLVERGIAMAKVVPEDPYCGLAEPGQLATDRDAAEMADTEEPAPEVLIDRATKAEDAARAVAGVSNSNGAEAHWSLSTVWLAASNGFSGSYQRSSHSVSASVVAGEGTGMETDYDWHSAVFGSDLRDAAEVGRQAGERTVNRLNPRKMPSGAAPVVYHPRVSTRLIGHLLGAINGTGIARGTSFLKDHMGDAVFASGINIVEDPHRPRGLRSKPFDAEGLPTEQRNLIDDGRLTTWLLDLRTARQLDLPPTGHATRGPGGPPSPSSTNVYLEAGAASPEELIADIDSGFYVMGLMGMGVNGVTGDYSLGADGFWIEKGEIAFPVSEMTIAGNLKDMYRQLTPANDLSFDYGTDAPTLRVEGMTVAGN